MCGQSAAQAVQWLTRLETQTRPGNDFQSPLG